MNDDAVDRDAVLSHLQRVLSSAPFRQAERSASLLRYLVDRSLVGDGDRLKEYTVGVEALGRGKDFDPRTDPIVRAEASRLRGRLERYYAGEGQSDVVVIELPKGAYAARFHARSISAVVPVAPPDEAQSARPAVSHRQPILWGALAALAIVGAYGAGAWTARSRSAASEPPMRVEVELQADESLGSDVGTDVVVAPDGSRAVYISIDSLGVTHLRARRFDGSAPVELPGTAGARGPFWSPDSRWIGFWAAGQLRKLAVDGGSPVVLCNATDLLGASWGDDGTIIAALDATSQLWRVDASSGRAPVAAVDLTDAHASPRWPQVLPGGKQVLYTALAGVGVDRGRIEVASLTDGKRATLVEGGTFGRYVAPDHLTFVNQGTLYAVKFDRARLETRGPKVPILDDVAYDATFGFAQISIAETGLAIYRRARPNGSLIVARVDSAGRRTPILSSPGQYAWPSLSPDGTRLALSVIESGVPRLSVFTNLTDHPRLAWSVAGYDAGVWTRDGRQIVARGSRGIVWLPALGGEPRGLIESPKISVPWTFTPGDRRLAFAMMDPATAFDLWTVPIDRAAESLHAGTPQPVLRSRFFETYPAISPDGRWLAYVSDASGAPEIYVRSLTDSAITVPVAKGARVPRWSRTGRRLFFASPDRRVMVVDYAVTGGKFIAGTPRQWASVRLADTGVLPNYELGANDASIVAIVPARPEEGQAANHVTVFRGLPDELRRKVP